MPGGFASPILGKASFVAIKLGGYTLAASRISKAYGRNDLNPWVVGAVRTGIGVVAGLCAVSLATRTSMAVLGLAFLASLLPFRIFEWWLLVWLFYDRKLERMALGWKVVGLGTVWSFALDVPAILGLFVVERFWVC